MENNFGIKKLLGFGAMRPPMNGEVVDYEEFTKMVDHFMNNGFNYFDTASVYLNGESENALKKCLTLPSSFFLNANSYALAFLYFSKEPALWACIK